MFGGHKSERVTFPQGAKWHELSYSNGVWMTDLPIEQQQCNQLLKNFYGNILVGGLGIGYAVNLLASMSDVNEVTVVEISPEVIELVAGHIIDPEGKVEVIEMDLFEYLKKEQEDTIGTGIYFDCAFYDLWQSDGEGTFHDMVVPLKKLSEGTVEHVVCWNEDIMKGQLFFNLQSRFRMCNLPPEFTSHCKIDLTLELLATIQDDKYWDWAVPFWKDWIEGGYPPEKFDDRAAAFVRAQ